MAGWRIDRFVRAVAKNRRLSQSPVFFCLPVRLYFIPDTFLFGGLKDWVFPVDINTIAVPENFAAMTCDRHAGLYRFTNKARKK